MKALFVTTILVLSTSLFSCKKDHDKKTSFNDVFKGQTFEGTFKYKYSKVHEPYWITFNNDNTFVWGEKSGKYPGTYSLNESARKITLNFSGGSVVTIAMQDDVTFGSYEYNSAAQFTIKFGEKYVSANESLVGTKWNGTSITDLKFISSVQAVLPAVDTFTYTREGPFVHLVSTYAEMYYALNKGKMKGYLYFALASDPYQDSEIIKQ